MRRLALALACVAPALLAGAATPAQADVFETIELVSQGFLASAGAGVQLQADHAHDAAISGDGRYVAFDGSFSGLTGVWWRDLQSGELRPVAVGTGVGGRACAPTISGAASPCDAELPSISEHGQYVSFTTQAPLAPHEDVNALPDVYVRNMNVQAPEVQSTVCANAEAEDAADLLSPCPYTLVSAADGSDAGLTYEAAKGYGSIAAGRSALSADGHTVAFVTTAVSDLTDPQDPATPSTPAMQVAVRNLTTRQTQLVSARYDSASGQALPGQAPTASEGSHTFGAVYAPGGESPSFPLATGNHALTPPAGASISADGSTVAWLGVNIGAQARVLSGEVLFPSYAEPLWRRVAAGPTTPTRRVTGGSDPENPACAASGETKLPEGALASLNDPCQGPFAIESNQGVWNSGEAEDFVPRLSADGYTVAFLASAPLVALGTDFGVERANRASDAYVSDMHPGVSRLHALTPLTELASGDEGNAATNAPILDVGISSDGLQVAFTTRRTQFPLGSPAYVSPTAALPGMAELFDADLADQTLTRVTQGYEGGPSAHPHEEAGSGEDPYTSAGDGALSPSFALDGDALAFSSTASNLVYGDGNTPPIQQGGPFDGGDAFVVHRKVFGATPTTQTISPEPPPPLAPRGWTLGATAVSQRNGSVRLYVRVPGPGALRVTARGMVVARPAGRLARRRRGSARPQRARATVVSRALATAARAAAAPEGGLLTLTLTLASRYRSLADARGGESATLALSFGATGHPTLRQSLAVTFVDTLRHAAKRSSHSGHTHRGHKSTRGKHPITAGRSGSPR
jgi:hypothetical protein